MTFKQPIKAISLRSVITFDFANKVYVYLIRTNNSSIFEIAKLLRPYVRHRIGFLVYRMYRIITKYITQRLTAFQELSKYRWSPKYSIGDLGRYQIALQDATSILSHLERYSPTHRFWTTYLPFVSPLKDRKTILLLVHKVNQPVSIGVYRLVANLYLRTLRDLTCPDYILLLLLNDRGSMKWVVVKTEEQSSREASKFVRILFRFLKKVDEKSATEGSDVIDSLDEIYEKTVEETEETEEKKEEPKSEITISGTKVRIEKDVKVPTTVSKEKEVRKAVSIAKPILRKRDKTQIVKRATIHKRIEPITQYIKQRVLTTTIRTPDRKTITNDVRWDSLLKYGIDVENTTVNENIRHIKTITLPATESVLGDYLVNNRLVRVVDHVKSTQNRTTDIFYSMISKCLSEWNMKLDKYEESTGTYRELSNIHTTGKLINVEWSDGDLKHRAQFFFPQVDEAGRIKFGDNYYSLVGQLYPTPIQSVKPGIVRLHTLNGIMIFERKKNVTTVDYIGCTLSPPLVYILLSDEGIGWESLMKKYKITYRVLDTSTISDKSLQDALKDTVHTHIASNKIIVFPELSGLQEHIVNCLFGLTRIDKHYKNLESKSLEPLSKSWFSELVNILNGRDNASYFFELRARIFIDPITEEFLKQEGYPADLKDLVLRICEILFEKPDFVKGPKNDLRNMRLRTYEQIIHLAYDMFVDSNIEYLRNRDLYNRKWPIDIKATTFMGKLLSGFRGFRLVESSNPLEEIVTQNRLDFRGYEGLEEESITLDNRYLHDTYKNVIDPIDTPEGHLIGVSNVAANGFAVLTEQGLLVSEPIKESKGRLLGPALSLVPFANKNEATRLMMSASQLKQPLLIEGLEPPAVLTGYENLISAQSSSTHVLRSPVEGTVVKIIHKDSFTEVTIKDNKGKEHTIAYESVRIGRSGIGKHSYLRKTLHVKEGEKVKKQQIIASTPWISKDELYSYGKNVFAVLCSYKGLTYEDGIVVSETLIDDLSSKHLDVYKCYLSPEDRLVFFGVNQVGQRVEPGEVLVSATSKDFYNYLESDLFEHDTIVITEAGYKIVSLVDGVVEFVNVYLSSKHENTIITRSAEHAKQFKKGVDVYYKNKPLEGLYIEIGVSYNMPLQVGDKLSTRHANKGVVSKILPEKEMPYVRSFNRRADVVFNDAAIIDRALSGVLLEMYTTKISYKLATMLLDASKNSRKFEQLEELSNLLAPFGPHNVSMYRAIFYDKHIREKVLEFVKKTGFYPIVVTPTQNVKNSEVVKSLHLLNIPLKDDIVIGGHTIRGVSGWIYLLKLEHLSFFKLKARAIGPYDVRTGQPIGGKLGGQKLGEYDFANLASWDVESVLNEFRMENIIEKKVLYSKIIEKGYVSLEELKKTKTLTEDVIQEGSLRMLDVYLKSILLDI